MVSSTALVNRRRLKRHRLSTDINIIDNLYQRPLGKLIDIHQEGLLLLGSPLDLYACHQISLMLPGCVNLQRQFELGVECLWCQSADDDNLLFWSGCSIIDKSPIASGCIDSLINIQS